MVMRKPAVDDELLDKPLAEISAAEFIRVLASLPPEQSAQAEESIAGEAPSSATVGVDEITVGQVLELHRNEKKKTELEREPGTLPDLINIAAILRQEKKKDEIELNNVQGGRRAIIVDADDMSAHSMTWDHLIGEIATEVVRRLGR